MTSSQKLFARNGLIVAVSFLLLSGVGYVFSAPTTPPPGASIPLPLTRGAAAETKAGALTVQGGLTVTGGSGLCIGGTGVGQCKTAWPATSTVQAATANLTATQNLNCYASNSGTFTYSGGTTSGRNCSLNFSITASTPGIPLSPSSTAVKCFRSGSNYAPDSVWTDATNVQFSYNESNQIVVSGTCLLWKNGSSGTAYGVASLSGISMRYIF